MKLQEIYKNQIINNLKVVNVVLGLSTIGNPSIQEFLEASKKSYTHICKSKQNKSKSIKMLMELCSDIMVMSEDCCFYNISILDFHVYSRPDIILDLVLRFTSQDRMVEFINNDYKKFVGLMTKFEESLGPNIKDSLSYIVMRNFLVLCELNLYRFAYYYACFIRTQIFISEGLNPRIEYSDLFKSELSLAIKKEQNKYSKAIKRKIKSGVVSTLNKIPLVDIDKDKLNKDSKKFIGDSFQTTLGSSSHESVESVTNAVDNFIDKRRKDNEIGTIKDVVKDKSHKIVNDVKTSTKEGAKAVGKGTVKVAKATVKSSVDPVANVVKDKAINPIKSKVDNALGVSPNKVIDDFVDSAFTVSESHIVDCNYNPSEKSNKRDSNERLRKTASKEVNQPIKEEVSKEVNQPIRRKVSKEEIKQPVAENIVRNTIKEVDKEVTKEVTKEDAKEVTKKVTKEDAKESTSSNQIKYSSSVSNKTENKPNKAYDKYASYGNELDEEFNVKPSRESKFSKLDKKFSYSNSFAEKPNTKSSKFDRLSDYKNTKDENAKNGMFTGSSIF